jgi:hypothetical protein
MKIAKPQCIYVPVRLWSYVPPKSRTIWTNLKNKANENLGKIILCTYLYDSYDVFKQLFAILQLKKQSQSIRLCSGQILLVPDIIWGFQKNFSKRWNFSAGLYA